MTKSKFCRFLFFYRNPIVCGVTSLGIDHTGMLGDTLDKIAWHKAGIFKVRCYRKSGDKLVNEDKSLCYNFYMHVLFEIVT